MMGGLWSRWAAARVAALGTAVPGVLQANTIAADVLGLWTAGKSHGGLRGRPPEERDVALALYSRLPALDGLVVKERTRSDARPSGRVPQPG